MSVANQASILQNIPFFKPNIFPSLQKELLHTLEYPTEDKAQKLESEFCSYIGSTFSISTNSTASALHLCLYAMQIKRGDKIICSINCHPMIPEMIRQFDAEPIFVDINQYHLLDFNSTERYISQHATKKIRAIILSYIAGQTFDVSPFYELAKAHKIEILEDASYALGGVFNGVKIGSKAALETLEHQSSSKKSTSSKSKTTSKQHAPLASFFGVFIDSQNPLAQCGMVTTENEEFASKLKIMRYHATIHKKTLDYPSYLYDVVDIASKFNVSNLDATYAIEQVKHCEEMITLRKNIANLYLKELQNVPHIELPPIIDKNNHIFSLFIIHVDKNRDFFARQLVAVGVECNLHFIPIHLLSYYKNKYNFKINSFPNALKYYQTALSIPIYSALKGDLALYVCEKILEVAKKHI